MSSSSKATRKQIRQWAREIHTAAMDNEQGIVNTIVKQVEATKSKARLRKHYIRNGNVPPAIPFTL